MIVLRNTLDCNVRINHEGINVLVPAGNVAEVEVPDSFKECKFLQELVADNSLVAVFSTQEQEQVQVQESKKKEKSKKKNK